MNHPHGEQSPQPASFAGLTLPQVLFRQAAALGQDHIAIREKAYGIWHSLNWQDYFSHTRFTALGLWSLGIRRGDNLARYAWINPDDPRFAAPDDMPAEISQYCRDTGQPIPDSEGAVVRCAMESLALRYRMILGWLEELTGSMIEVVHVVGGGSQNRVLCQMTATACGRSVLAGPVEATALGNVLMQAIARNDIGSIVEGRAVIGASHPLEEKLTA